MITPVILLQISSIQNFVVDTITRDLSKRLDTKVSVGNVHFRFFNTFRLQQLLVEDQKGDTLLHAGSIDANLQFWQLFRRKISVSSLTFNHIKVNLKKEADGVMNYRFLLQRDTLRKDSSFYEININRLAINDSELSFTDFTRQQLNGAFNPGKLRIENINTELSVATFARDSLDIELHSLTAREKSGIELDNISFRAKGSHNRIEVFDLKIDLPQSHLYADKIQLKDSKLLDILAFRPSLSVHLPLHETEITLNDLSPLLPGFKGSTEKVKLNALITGKLSNLKAQQLSLAYGSTVRLNASVEINGLPNLEESFIYAKVDKLQANHSEVQDVIARIQNRPFLLPEEMRRLGLLTYKGNITGFLSNLVAFGVIKTNLGNISSDISLRFENHLRDLYYNGTLRTSGFELGKFVNNKQLGGMRMVLNTKGTKLGNQDLKGTLTASIDQLDFNRYSYSKASLKGEYDGTGFNGNIQVKDDNIDADFTGILDFRNPRLPVFNFDLIVRNTNLQALNLIKNYPDSRLSFHGTTNLTGNNLDNLNGHLQIDDIHFRYLNDSISANAIFFNSRTSSDYTHFDISSDYLNGSFSGDFKYSTIGNTFKMVLAQYLPSLAEGNNNKRYIPNNIHIDLKLGNTSEIVKILRLPYKLGGEATIRGDINESINRIELTASLDALSTGAQNFENFTLNLANNRQQQLVLTGRTRMYNRENDLQNVVLTASASKDQLDARLMWQNNDAVTNAGEVNTRTRLSREEGELTILSRILPTEIILSDSIWNLRASEAYYKKSEGLSIRNFLFESQSQFIHIDGVASENRSDSLLVTMNDLNLDYVMRLINLKGISIGGLITGDLLLYSLLKEPIYLADVYIENMSLNDTIVGNGAINTHWNQELRQLDIQGDITTEKQSEVAKLGGSFTPSSDSLDLQINAQRFPVSFLNRYFEGVASNFRGQAQGNFRIAGPTKELRFTGDLMVSGGQVTIDMLQTTYRFNDRVKLTPYNIEINQLTLYDEERNRARANGSIAHDGGFGDMVYDVKISTDNLMVMNTTSQDDDFFYGKAYASGQARIFGDFSETNIVVNGVSRPKTKCYLSMASSSSVLEGDFIRFEKKQSLPSYESESTQQNQRIIQDENRFNVKTDIQIELTPEAEIEILVDPRAGDKISGRGRGNLRIRFDTFSDVDLFGTVELEQGNYLFTLQTVIRKEFRINRGSTIAWTGDPFEAQVNINGYYPLTASLTDLLEPSELQQVTSRSTVPVHCLLYLTDDLMSPTIRFGIDLPSSDESVKSRVTNIVNTEEMMNRQILYLLLFHKFFTPDYMRTTAAVGVNEGLSFATATVSAQINNWIQSTLNTNIFSIGVDWQKTNAESDEVKAQILIQPNNRLVINGNIGYRNDNISENKFIGDFDLEYKLIESGKLRFTAYNHTIDRAQLREAKTTQGVGLIYREDFNNVREMVEYYWEAFLNIFKKKVKKNQQPDTSQESDNVTAS